MIERLSDWETRLAAYLVVVTETARAGRVNFCALFAAGAVEAMTGDNPADAYRGRYSAVAAALETTIDEVLPERPPAMARRGDLAWNGEAVGLVIGLDALFVGVNTDGAPDLVRVPRREWVKAWAVG